MYVPATRLILFKEEKNYSNKSIHRGVGWWRKANKALTCFVADMLKFKTFKILCEMF